VTVAGKGRGECRARARVVEWVALFLINTLNPVSDQMHDIIFHSRSNICKKFNSISAANPMASPGYFL